MHTSILSQDDIAVAIHSIHRIATHIHMPAEPDTRTASFLIGVAEIMLRVRAQGSLSIEEADLTSIYASRVALGSDSAASKTDTEGYRAGLLCGAAMAGTLDPHNSSTLVRSARAISLAHGMELAEAIATLTLGKPALVSVPA